MVNLGKCLATFDGMIRVALEASGLLRQHPTGIPVYIKNLTYSLNELSDLNVDHCYKLSRYKKRKFAPHIDGVGRNWYLGPIYFSGTKPNIIHSSDTKIPKIPGTKLVATIHDLAVLHPDHNFEGFTNEKFRESAREKYRKIIRSADAIISVSECTKRDFLSHFDFPEEKIFVTHLGFAKHIEKRADVNLKDLNLPIESGKYFLYVGSITIRKNMINLIKAFERADVPDDFKLVLAGNAAMGFEEVMAVREKLKRKDRIIVAGYIDDKWMPTLYHNAKAFLFPTYYEGFGLPIIEAMSTGLPVLAANRGAAPEVGGKHAIYADPFSVDDIAKGIEKTLTASQLDIEAAKSHAASFTWAKTASETKAVYEKVLGQ
jgi:glycosyltransferase involved in cell wall biosynthesis